MANEKERLDLLQAFILCAHSIYLSEYTPSSDTFSSSAPNAEFVRALFFMDFTKNPVMPTAAPEAQVLRGFVPGKPCAVTNSLGMMWIADANAEGGIPHTIHLLGPAFPSDFSPAEIEVKLNGLHLSILVKSKFLETIHSLPVVSLIRFYEYGLMLHYALTQQRCLLSEYTHWDSTGEKSNDAPPAYLVSNHATYAAEQQILQYVREGNLDYRAGKDRLSSYGAPGDLTDRDFMRQAKDYVIIFTALCCRAAVEGGLAPEIAYSMSDGYIRQIEAAETLADVTDASHTMMDDYVLHVFRLKTRDGISPKIQQVCDQIRLDPAQKLDVHALAQSIGYQDYYFTKKFKQEVGITVRDFAVRQKIEQAKKLLRDSSLRIAEVSDQLGFASQSHFGEVFRQTVGISPGEYRETLAK